MYTMRESFITLEVSTAFNSVFASVADIQSYSFLEPGCSNLLKNDAIACVGLPEIKVAYRQMALRYHPDVCPPTEREECTRRFLQVQEAYDTLSDPDLRAHYDLWLQNPLNTRTLAAGFRKGNRRGTGKSDIDAKDQWESQLQGLRNRGERGGKQESWASRMRKRRESDSQLHDFIKRLHWIQSICTQDSHCTCFFLFPGAERCQNCVSVTVLVLDDPNGSQQTRPHQEICRYR